MSGRVAFLAAAGESTVGFGNERLMKAVSRVFRLGRSERTMPCSSIAISIGTPLTCMMLIGSKRIGQSNWCHWAKSWQRSRCCSCAMPTTTSFCCWTHSWTLAFQAGTACRHPRHQEAKWINRTFLPRNWESETGSPSAKFGNVKSGCGCPTCGAYRSASAGVPKAISSKNDNILISQSPYKKGLELFDRNPRAKIG